MITLKRLIYGQMESWIIARAILLLASNVTERSAVEKDINGDKGNIFVNSSHSISA